MNKSIKEFEKKNPTPKLIASKFFFLHVPVPCWELLMLVTL